MDDKDEEIASLKAKLAEAERERNEAKWLADDRDQRIEAMQETEDDLRAQLAARERDCERLREALAPGTRGTFVVREAKDEKKGG